MENTLPLVSVVCTTYNQEPYVKQALDGFVMQQCNFPIEVIVHDDASTDKTAEIIKEYATKYPFIRAILQTENQYSKGFPIWEYLFTKEAKGKYIAICEGDDYWTDPLKLQKQVDFMEINKSISFCFHNAMVDYVGSGISEPFNTKLDSKTYNTKNLLLDKWLVPTASILLRSQMLENLFPEWYKKIYNGDLGLELLLSNRGDFFYINEIMSVYRKNAINSLSVNGPKGRHFLRRLLFLLFSFRRHTFPKSFFYCTYAIFLVRLKIVYNYFPFVIRLKNKLFRPK